MRRPLVLVLREDDCDRDVADPHGDGADGEDGFPAQAVDVQDRGDGRDEHDDPDDARREEARRVGAEAEGAEDLGRVVEDGVDACPLLEEHGDGGHDDTAEHGHRLEEGGDGDELEFHRVEGGHLGEMGEVVLDSALLEDGLGFDLEELDLDDLAVDVHVAERGEGLAGFVFAAMMDEPTRAEGHEDHSDNED